MAVVTGGGWGWLVKALRGDRHGPALLTPGSGANVAGGGGGACPTAPPGPGSARPQHQASPRGWGRGQGVSLRQGLTWGPGPWGRDIRAAGALRVQAGWELQKCCATCPALHPTGSGRCLPPGCHEPTAAAPSLRARVAGAMQPPRELPEPPALSLPSPCQRPAALQRLTST